MEFDILTLSWLIGGVALILAEIVVPGGVVVFLGLSAVIVAMLRAVGLLESLISAFTVWFVVSIALLIGLRGVVNRILPGETSFQSPNEDLAALGTVVEVVETVNKSDANGRIHYSGTSWPATSLSGTIPKGSMATMAFRENLVWFVEPAGELIADEPWDEER